MNCDKCNKKIKTGEKFNAEKRHWPDLTAGNILCKKCAAKQGKKTNFQAGGIVN